jgi:hypothetical protein
MVLPCNVIQVQKTKIERLEFINNFNELKEIREENYFS